VTTAPRELSYPVAVPGGAAVVAIQHPEDGLGNSDIVRASLPDGTVDVLFAEPGQACFTRPSPAEPDRVAFIHRGADGSAVKAVDAATGSVETLLTDEVLGGWITAFAWSPDGTELVVEAGVPGVANSLYRWDGEGVTELLGFDAGTAILGGTEAGLTGLAPGKRLWTDVGILFAGGSGDTTDLGVVGSDGEYEWLVDSDSPIVPVEWLSSGEDRDAAYIEKGPGKSLLKTIRGGETQTLTDRGVADITRFGDSGATRAVVRKSYDSAGDLWVDGEKQTTVGTCPDAQIEPTARSYESHDGTTIPTMCYTPDDVDLSEGAGGPALVYAHGGVGARIEAVFRLREQALAAAGFTVLAPDYRGSGGYGRSFLHANDGQMGVVDLDDIVAGARYLREQGFDRVGIYGESWGGYFALSAVTRRDAFDAAVAICPATDLQLAAANGRLSIAARKFGVEGDGADSGVLAERSPITDVDAISVPLQLFHGDEDIAIPVEHTRSFVEELDAAGVAHDVTIYEGEDHLVEDPENRADMVQTMRAFFADALAP